MPGMYQIGYIALGVLFVVAGYSHWIWPNFYERLMPMWMGGHRFWVAATGLLEIVIGLGFFIEVLRPFTAWIAATMLGGYFIVHVNMLLDKEAGMGLPTWALVVRLVLQGLLVAFVWQYT